MEQQIESPSPLICGEEHMNLYSVDKAPVPYSLPSHATEKPSKIVILNTLNFHYECLGFLIEYSMYYYNFSKRSLYGFSVACEGEDKFAVACEGKNKKIPNPIIYLKYNGESDSNNKDLLNWKQFYSKLYGLNEDNWKNFNNFDVEDVSGENVNLSSPSQATEKPSNLLFLTTDDDPGFNIEWTKKYKVISINHLITRCIYNNTSRFLNINIRYSNFLNKDNEKWCFPFFNGVSREEKKTFLLKNPFLTEERELHIVCLGKHCQPHPEQPKVMFINNNKIKFSIIDRHILHNYNSVSNIDSYHNLCTPLFFDILKSADYILCFNYNTDHAEVSLSGSINIAFSFGARLIIPKEWQDNLQIRSAISYDFKDGAFYVPKITNEMIDDIFDEREEFIQHRNLVLEDAIQLLTPVMPPPKMLKL